MKLIHDRRFIEWIKTARSCKWKVSVCTGALLLGIAGFLKDKSATTHSNALAELEKYASRVVGKRIVVMEM